jgi:rRNA-processing protein FCF1
MDGNFIVVCLKMQQDPVNAVHRLLQIKGKESCEVVVPEGVIHELELLGPGFAEAAAYAKNLQMPGEKADENMTAHDHIEKIIGNPRELLLLVVTV